MVAGRRVELRLQLPWPECIVCGNDRVIDGRCAACGEVYERRKTAITPRELEERALLERIASTPDDDGPRQVFADLLIEREDPRGSFIALQLRAESNPPDAAVALELSRLSGLMVDAVPPGVDSSWVAFRRGFADTVTWPPWTDPSHPTWQLVRELVVPRLFPDNVQLSETPLGGPPLANLEVLRGATPRIAEFLLENPPPRLRTLELVVATPVTAGHLRAIEQLVAALPRLVELCVRAPPAQPPAAQWGTAMLRALAPRLFRLRLPIAEVRPQAAVEAVRTAPHLVVQLEPAAVANSWLEVDSDGLRLAFRGTLDPLFLQLVDALAPGVPIINLDTGAFERLSEDPD